MHLVLAGLPELGDIPTGRLAGVAQPVGDVAAHDRRPVDGVGGRLEAASDRLAAAPHAFAEHGQRVDGVVDRLAEEREQEQERDDQQVARDRPDPLARKLRIEAHAGPLPGSRIRFTLGAVGKKRNSERGCNSVHFVDSFDRDPGSCAARLLLARLLVEPIGTD